MIIIGVDPGLKATGYGVIDYSRTVKLLETGTIEPKARDPIEVKLEKVHRNLSDIVRQYKPETMILEKLYSHYKHPTTASIMGHVRGVICLVCAQCRVNLVEYSVKRIRKALVGNGNASKAQVQASVINTLKIPEQKFSLDASDALALALAHGYLNRRSV
jgi:crossover junction endodeoxyribonuclease RuvC